MLFRKKIPRSCTYCKHSTAFDGEQILCIRKGVVDGSKACKKFRYDPCKRIPVKAKALDFDKYSAEDFKL